eukprot:CAMPEP_0170647654 /NCGR_PEP_ID=MMETSP0224-20130122/44297_1 /TAXON_ID=285029 /ORGANISM="Togula jolla, Strain CCCM 725" /LENGTH=416 /DNA_ID=CAMNT_0010979089 /DNA_START=10 /DNA_END=1260 /DNA_ORIENTATION=-
MSSNKSSHGLGPAQKNEGWAKHQNASKTSPPGAQKAPKIFIAAEHNMSSNKSSHGMTTGKAEHEISQKFSWQVTKPMQTASVPANELASKLSSPAAEAKMVSRTQSSPSPAPKSPMSFDIEIEIPRTSSMSVAEAVQQSAMEALSKLAAPAVESVQKNLITEEPQNFFQPSSAEGETLQEGSLTGVASHSESDVAGAEQTASSSRVASRKVASGGGHLAKKRRSHLRGTRGSMASLGLVEGSYRIRLGKQVSGFARQPGGWYLGVANSSTQDSRNENSTYVAAFEPGKPASEQSQMTWKLESVPGSEAVRIVQPNGWYLTARTDDPKDARDESSNYVMIVSPLAPKISEQDGEWMLKRTSWGAFKLSHASSSRQLTAYRHVAPDMRGAEATYACVVDPYADGLPQSDGRWILEKVD